MKTTSMVQKLFLLKLTCLVVLALFPGCSGNSSGGGGTSSPPSAQNIGVIDSIAPVDDLQMPFGSVTQASAPARSIVLVNYGGQDLTIGTIAGTDALAAPFSMSGDACSGQTLAPAAHCTITVQFAPTGTGAFSDSFDIPSDDPDTPSLTMAVSGTGVAGAVPDISVTDSTAPGNDLKIPFGGVGLGNSSSQTVTMTNIGTGDLVIGSIANLNPLAAPFAITADACSGRTLAPLAACAMTITFTPSTAKTASDTFEIPSNDPDTLVISFAVSGKGIPLPPAAVAATRINGDTSAIQSNPIMAFNNAGHGLAVWEVYSGNSTKLAYSYFNGSTWSAQAQLASNGYQPDVTTDGTDFMIVYSNSYVYALPYADTGGPGTAARIDPLSGGYSNYAPKVASNGSGFAAAWTWYEYASGRYRIYSNIYNGGSWTAALAIESGVGNAYEPQIASNGSGYAVAWYQNDGSSISGIYANIYDAGSWAGAANIKTGTTGAYFPRIASNGSGYAVAWYQSDGSANSIYANIYSAGSWAGAASIKTGSTSAYYPRIASNGSGYAAAWYQSDGSANSIYANIYSAGSWSTASVIEASSSNAYQADITSNGSGYAVAWYQYDGSVYNIYANTYDSGSWSTETNIETGAASASTNGPRIFRKGSGYAAAWSQPDSSDNSTIYLNTCSGGGWNSAAQALSSVSRGMSGNPKMAINQNGEALAVWQQFHNGNSRIYGSATVSGAWGAPFPVSAEKSSAYESDVASNGPDFMIVYNQGSTMYARPYTVASGLGAAVNIDVSNGSSSGGRIASNNAGYAAAWTRYDSSSGHNRIYASTLNDAAWNSAVPISPGTGDAYNSRIVSNGEGYAAAWTQVNASGYYDVYASVQSAGSWSVPEPIENAEGYADSVAVASDGAGYSVAWYQYDGTGYTGIPHIYANVYSAGSWTAAAVLNAGNPVDAYSPSIASNGAGYAVVWYQYDSSWNTGIYANIYSAGSWTAESPVADFSPNGAREPKIASDGTGYAVVWYQYDPNYQSIFASKFGSGAWTAPALLDTNDGAAQEPSVFSNGAGYGAIWSQYDPAATGVTDIWSELGL